MAERRMFSKAIVHSARFLRMPPAARLLYYDLGMSADDDGIVEAFTVLRTTGAAEADLRSLAARGFVRILNEDLVSYISDWKQNNQIRSDRYKPSVYSALLVQLGDEGSSDQAATAGKPSDNHLETQYSLVKDRLDQVSAAGACAPAKRERFTPPSFEDVRDYMIQYAAEHGLQIDAALQAEKFISYHDSRGWISGQSGRKIKRWKGAAGTWMCNLREWAKDSPEKNPPKREINWGVLANE